MVDDRGRVALLGTATLTINPPKPFWGIEREDEYYLDFTYRIVT